MIAEVTNCVVTWVTTACKAAAVATCATVVTAAFVAADTNAVPVPAVKYVTIACTIKPPIPDSVGVFVCQLSDCTIALI